MPLHPKQSLDYKLILFSEFIIKPLPFLQKFVPSCIIAMAAIAASATPPKPTMLVGARDGSLASAQKLIGNHGTIVGRDRESALYQVTLARGENVKTLQKVWLRSHLFAAVVRADQEHIDRYSDESVTDHLNYLKQVAKHSGKRESNTLDWWGAYQHWLHDHVNKNGVFDPEPFVQGAKIRNSLPPGRIGTSLQDKVSGTWSYVGPHNEQPVPGRLYDGLGPLTGRINAVAVDPLDNKIVYVCSAGGGVWKTIDRGVTWKPLSDGWQFLQTSSIAIDPNFPDTLYVGTGDFPQSFTYSFGIMKSDDGGTTWTNYGAATFANLSISHIAVDPNNSQVVIATAGRGAAAGGGIYRSVNGGQTWTKAALPNVSWDGLSISVPDALGKVTLWAAGESAVGANIYKSVNEGLTWTKVTTPIGAFVHASVDIACSKVSPGTVYILDPHNPIPSAGNHIWKTINSGASWVDVTTGFPNGQVGGPYYTWDQSSYNFYIGTSKITNNGVVTDGVYVGMITIAMSPDGGKTWMDISKSYKDQNQALSHVDQHAFFADTLAANTVYFGNDGGVHRMVYDPVAKSGTFTPLNASLYVTQWYFVATHPTDATRIMGGLQDNANPTAIGNLNFWINPGGGDGSAVTYDQFNPNIAYNCDQDLTVYRTTSGWTTTPDDISDGTAYSNESINMFPPITTGNKGTAPSPLFAGTDHLWMWDPVNLWTPDISGQALSTAANLRTIATCPSDSKRLYTGSDDGQLWEIRNMSLGANAVAVEVDNGYFGSSPVVSIAPLPTNAADLLAGMTQAGPGNLLHCTNVDAANPVWTDVTGTGATALPPLPINAVARDPYAPNTTWYVGTDVGVFMTTNAGTTWSNITRPLGLPNVQVNDLKINKTTGFMYAATYGRGLWKIAIIGNGPVLKTLTAPTAVVSGRTFTATVTLTAAAPTGGFLVNLTTDNTSLKPPATVTVPAGATAVNVSVPSTPLAFTTPFVEHLSATQGTTKLTATMTCYPASLVSLTATPNPATGGVDNLTCVITLNAPAPAGFVVTLNSSDPAVAPVPASVTVLAGHTTVSFTVVTTAPIAPKSVTISATRGSTKTATVTVN
jgi:photosystem II stability/assembly factor-like uncharacterized protein